MLEILGRPVTCALKGGMVPLIMGAICFVMLMRLALLFVSIMSVIETGFITGETIEAMVAFAEATVLALVLYLILPLVESWAQVDMPDDTM